MVKITPKIQKTPSKLLIKQIASQTSTLLSTNTPLLNLSQGSPNLPLFDAAYDSALELLNTRKLSYTDVQGMEKVRTTCAKFLNKVVLQDEKEDGLYKAEHVCVTNGAVGAIYNTLSLQISSPEDIVIAPLPSYGLYASDTAILGGTFIPLQCDNDVFTLQAQDLQNMFETYGERIRVVILCFPNNPTGMCLSEKQAKEITEELERQLERFPDSFSVVLDEVYTGIDGGAAASFFDNSNNDDDENENDSSNKQGHTSILKHASSKLRQSTFVILSISKGLGGAPGARAGFVACTDVNLMDHLQKVQMATGANVAVLSQCMLGASLEYILQNPKKVLGEVKRFYGERTDYVFERLKNMEKRFLLRGIKTKEQIKKDDDEEEEESLLLSFCPKQSQGTFYVVGQFLCLGPTDIDVMNSFRDAYKTAPKKRINTNNNNNNKNTIASHGVAVVPLSAFSMDEKLCMVRICCAVDLDVLRLAMDVIESVVEDSFQL